ncbi:hypothetical protein VXQ18_11825 [Brucella abortus]|nr:hypothetical protein [Brucella abortus]
MTLGNSVNGDLYVLAMAAQRGSTLAGAHRLPRRPFSGNGHGDHVACVALSIMISNHLVLPLIISSFAKRHLAEQRGLTKIILNTRRITIIVILALAFSYYRLTSNNIHLASIGFVSFAAVAQFAPALIGGLFWRNANGRGGDARPFGGLHRLVLHAASANRRTGKCREPAGWFPRLHGTAPRSAVRAPMPCRLPTAWHGALPPTPCSIFWARSRAHPHRWNASRPAFSCRALSSARRRWQTFPNHGHGRRTQGHHGALSGC